MPIVGDERCTTLGASPLSWNQLFAGVTRSPTLQRIMRSAFGADGPYGAEPLSFVTRTELEHIARGLAVGPGDVCVDLGCGRGGPALWVARTTGAQMLGIDVSSVAVGQATARTRALHLDGQAAFHLGDLYLTGLRDASVAGVMSIDVLWGIDDRPAALREVARILRPGAQFVLTTWDLPVALAGWQGQVTDHRPLLRDAGFEIISYEPTSAWESRVLAVYAAVSLTFPLLIREMGQTAAGLLGREVAAAPLLAQGQRIVAVARRR